MADDPRLERLKELSKNKFRTPQETTERDALAAEYPQFNTEEKETEKQEEQPVRSTDSKKKSA